MYFDLAYRNKLKWKALLPINYPYDFEKVFNQIRFNESEWEGFLINLKI